MKSRKKEKTPEIVSSIIESYDKNENGILGFTIKYEDGSFENKMQSFTVINRDLVLAELTIERELTLVKLTSKK